MSQPWSCFRLCVCFHRAIRRRGIVWPVDSGRVFGLTGVVALVVAGTLLAAAITNQQPFGGHRSTAKRTCADVALTYLLPAAVVRRPCGWFADRYATEVERGMKASNSRPSEPF